MNYTLRLSQKLDSIWDILGALNGQKMLPWGRQLTKIWDSLQAFSDISHEIKTQYKNITLC